LADSIVHAAIIEQDFPEFEPLMFEDAKWSWKKALFTMITEKSYAMLG
jgi:hypothetical protein